jgi:hypothetical protein
MVAVSELVGCRSLVMWTSPDKSPRSVRRRAILVAVGALIISGVLAYEAVSNEMAGKATPGVLPRAAVAALLWAIISLPLRGGRWSLVTEAIMRFTSSDGCGFFSFFAVRFRTQRHAWPSLRDWRSWPEII